MNKNKHKETLKYYKKHNGHIKNAAIDLGISTQAFHQRCKKLGLEATAGKYTEKQILEIYNSCKGNIKNLNINIKIKKYLQRAFYFRNLKCIDNRSIPKKNNEDYTYENLLKWYEEYNGNIAAISRMLNNKSPSGFYIKYKKINLKGKGKAGRPFNKK